MGHLRSAQTQAERMGIQGRQTPWTVVVVVRQWNGHAQDQLSRRNNPWRAERMEPYVEESHGARLSGRPPTGNQNGRPQTTGFSMTFGSGIPRRLAGVHVGNVHAIRRSRKTRRLAIVASQRTAASAGPVRSRYSIGTIYMVACERPKITRRRISQWQATWNMDVVAQQWFEIDSGRLCQRHTREQLVVVE